MPHSIRRRALLGASLFAAAALSACVVAPLGGYPPQSYPHEGEVVMQAPPAPRYEVIPVAPAIGSIWIGGYWGWSGRRYDWRPGYWSAPRPGYRWVPHRWDRAGPGWRAAPGHWGRG